MSEKDLEDQFANELYELLDEYHDRGLSYTSLRVAFEDSMGEVKR